MGRKQSWIELKNNTIIKHLHSSLFTDGVTGIDKNLVVFWNAENLTYPHQLNITIEFLNDMYKAYISKTKDDSRTRLCFRQELKQKIKQYSTFIEEGNLRIEKINDMRYSMKIELNHSLKLSNSTFETTTIKESDDNSFSKRNNLENKEYYEGRKKEVRLLNRIRNRAARDECLRISEGKCYVCGFDFGETYGNIGKGFLEVHHKKPLNQYNDCHPITLDKLCAVCSNCHRMIHRTKEPMDVEEFKLFVQNKKNNNKQFAEAYEPWSAVYEACPNANKAIYTNGAKIIKALFQTTTDEEEKRRLAELAIELQDKRIEYFGNDPKFPTAYILGEKGLAYLDYFGSEKIEEAHECLRQSVQQRGDRSKIIVLVKLVETSCEMYKMNPGLYEAEVLADYHLARKYLETIATNPSNKNAESAKEQKQYVDEIFENSGISSK